MPKKDREELKRNNAPLNGALKFFIGGCLAEIYLLMVRKYYVNGNIDQMLSWDAAMPTLMGIGAALLALGVALAVLWKKERGWKRTAAWTAAFAGLFLSAGNWMVRAVYPTGVTVLTVLTAAAMLLGVLWCLYARECFFAMTILGTGLFATWVCRHGIGSQQWRVFVIAGACVYLLLLAAAFMAARKLERTDGMLGALRILPKETDGTVLMVSCGLSAAAVVLSLFSAAVAYYAIWVLGIVIFILAVYYTVREL